ncbi:MAG: hypothetical protein AAF489_14230 [Bacteroidota bacterium]
MIIPLNSSDAWTAQLQPLNIYDWATLTAFVQNLPYGRNKNRSDFSLVISERKGSCSSKHAYLKEIAQRNNLNDVQLIMGIYKMNPKNTPGIGNLLAENGLAYLPEAHCYLKIKGQRKDFTQSNSNTKNWEADLLEEQTIVPDQVSEFKVTYHKEFLRNWLTSCDLDLSFDALWKVREACINKLSNTKIDKAHNF